MRSINCQYYSNKCKHPEQKKSFLGGFRTCVLIYQNKCPLQVKKLRPKHKGL